MVSEELLQNPIQFAVKQQQKEELDELRESTERIKWLSSNLDLLYPGPRAPWKN